MFFMPCIAFPLTAGPAEGTGPEGQLHTVLPEFRLSPPHLSHTCFYHQAGVLRQFSPRLVQGKLQTLLGQAVSLNHNAVPSPGGYCQHRR